MKQTVLILGILMLLLPLFADNAFDGKISFPNQLIVCFNAGTLTDGEGHFTLQRENGVIQTGLPTFDALAKRYQFDDLTPYFTFVKDKSWNEDGVYLQNVMLLHIADNTMIESALSDLVKDANIAYAEYNPIIHQYFTPNDADWSQLWHLPQIYCPEAWDYEQGNQDVVIGITDTGCKWNHPDLRANIHQNSAEMNGVTINWDNHTITGGNGIDDDGNGYVDDVIGWDFGTSSSSSDDDNNPYQNLEANSHGTHVSGCAGAVGNNEIGVCGSAPNISLIVCKGTSDTVPSDGVYNAYTQILYCADTGADIINCSWGGAGGASTANYTVNYATDHGALVVVAAGNDATEHNSSYHDYPSDCENAVCVAATTTGDVKADFSDYGEPIDVCAPGTGIISTYYNDTYANLQGTSMASPITAGVCALIKSHFPTFTPAQIKARLMSGCDNIDSINPDYAGLLGAGRINAYRTLMYDQIPNLSLGSINLVELDGDGDGVANPGETVGIDIEIVNDNGWVDGNTPVGTLTCSAAGVTVTQGTSTYPTLFNGVSFFNDVHFQITSEATLANLTIPMTITINANQTGAVPYQKSFDFSINLSLIQAGWPVALGGASLSQSGIANIDNAGPNEVVFGDHNGNLHAVEPNGQELAGFPVDLGTSITSAVAMADVNNDGKLEMAVPTLSSGLFLVDSSAQTIFTCPTGQLKANPVIADVDGNGTYEVIAADMTGNIYVVNADGSSYAGFPVNPGNGGSMCSPVVADFDNDSHLDILTVTTTGNIQVVSTANAQVLSGWPQNITSTSWKGGVAMDLDGNSDYPEFVVCTFNGHLYGYSHSGTQLFSRDMGANVRSSIAVGDINGDGSDEIIFCSTTGTLYVLNNAGEDVAPFPIQLGGNVEATPICHDMDGDGKRDIIVGDQSGNLHSIDYSGLETANFPVAIGGTINYSASVGDVDSDNDVDIAVANQINYYLVDYKRAGGNSTGWSCFRGNLMRQGSAFGTTAVHDPTIPNTAITALLPNYPNPFNPTTTVAFSMKEAGHARLSIYNTRGQLVRTLVNDTVTAGQHNVVWNGTDDNGRSVASGIYFAMFNTNSQTMTRKMIMMK